MWVEILYPQTIAAREAPDPGGHISTKGAHGAVHKVISSSGNLAPGQMRDLGQESYGQSYCPIRIVRLDGAKYKADWSPKPYLTTAAIPRGD
jgi:hypothetical protein